MLAERRSVSSEAQLLPASLPPPIAPHPTVPAFAAGAFLAYLGAKAVSVSLSGDDLCVIGPLTDADRAALVMHRRAVIEALSRAKSLPRILGHGGAAPCPA